MTQSFIYSRKWMDGHNGSYLYGYSGWHYLGLRFLLWGTRISLLTNIFSLKQVSRMASFHFCFQFYWIGSSGPLQYSFHWIWAFSWSKTLTVGTFSGNQFNKIQLKIALNPSCIKDGFKPTGTLCFQFSAYSPLKPGCEIQTVSQTCGFGPKNHTYDSDENLRDLLTISNENSTKVKTGVYLWGGSVVVQSGQAGEVLLRDRWSGLGRNQTVCVCWVSNHQNLTGWKSNISIRQTAGLINLSVTQPQISLKTDMTFWESACNKQQTAPCKLHSNSKNAYKGHSDAPILTTRQRVTQTARAVIGPLRM